MTSGDPDDEMKIRIQFYAQLREITGVEVAHVDIADETTVSDVLERLYSKYPALRVQDKSILVGAGVEFVSRNYKVKGGDELAIMPPVQGG